MPSRKCCYVYVIEGHGESKVGIAADPKKRFYALKKDGAVRVVGWWHRPVDALLIEQRAHAILLDGRRRDPGRTEWFRVSPEDAIAAVTKAIGDLNAGMVRPKVGFDWAAYRAKLKEREVECEAWLATQDGTAWAAQWLAPRG